jgi:hypothetical protein
VSGPAAPLRPPEHPAAPALDLPFIDNWLRHCIGRQVQRKNLKRAAVPPHVPSCGHSRWYARPAQSPPMSRAAPLTTATHWSADNPTHLGGYQADANVRSGRANASPARGPTPEPRMPARPALALRAPPDLLLQVTAPWTTCLQPSAPDRCPPALVLGLPCPIASFTPLDCTPMLQAFNCYVYRKNLKKRVKAGEPQALRARSKELEREEKKSKKRKAARALAAPARPRPLPRPPKQKKRTADGLVVRDGQCEGTCKDGKRCRVGPGTFACAKPLNLGSEACFKRAASQGQARLRELGRAGQTLAYSLLR